MAFKLSLVADVRDWLKGTSDVEKSLDQVSDSLNKLADDSEQDAKQAADALANKFDQAFDEVKAKSRTAGDALGTNVKQGTQKASEGTDSLKENAKQNAKEIGASFDGSAQSIADGFQGLAAEAFEGFGPAGVAAGVAVAAGIGLASAALDQADADAKEAKAHVQELGKSLATAATHAQGMADAIADSMSESVKNPQGIIETLFGGGDTNRLSLYAENIKRAGLTYSQVLKAMAGDDEAYNEVAKQAYSRTDNEHEQTTVNFLEDLNKRNQAFKLSQEWAKAYAESEVAAAQRAADAAATFGDSLTDNLSVADEGLDQFVKDSNTSWSEWNKKIKESHKEGTLDLKSWTDELKRRAKENKTVTDFTVNVAPKLSEEAKQNFEKLPTETQAQIAKAYNKGDKGAKKQILNNLEAEAKVTKIDVDTSKAKTSTNSKPIEIPVTANLGDAKDAANNAANAAQSEANKSSNAIELKTKFDRGEAQRQLNRLAASLTPPTITIKTRVQKEVP